MSTRSVASQQASSSGVESYIDSPDQYDVYLVRGNITRRYLGNRTYRSLIREHKDRYQKENRHQPKNEIAMNVMKYFKDKGGTFYYKDKNDGSRVVATAHMVLRKIKQALSVKPRKKPEDNNRTIIRPLKLSSDIPCREETESVPTVLATSSQEVQEQFLVTILKDGTQLVDTVSVAPSSTAYSSTAPPSTSQQDSEDQFLISDSGGHWYKIHMKSKNDCSRSMTDQLSISSSFSGAYRSITAPRSESSYHHSSTASSMKTPIFPPSGNTPSTSTFRSIDQSIAAAAVGTNKMQEPDDIQMMQQSDHHTENQMPMTKQDRHRGSVQGQEDKGQGGQACMTTLDITDLCNQEEELMKQDLGCFSPYCLVQGDDLDGNKPSLLSSSSLCDLKTRFTDDDQPFLGDISEGDYGSCNSDDNCFKEEIQEQNKPCLRKKFQLLSL
jgi:hypothetical protein